jgi:hypothetical protein
VTGGWQIGDARVLAAIGVYQRQCSLAELLAAAERIADTLPSGDEIGEALGRLAGAGLARVFEDWTFDLTDEGSSLFLSGPHTSKAGLVALLGELEAFEPGRARVALPRGAMDRAVAEYREHHE